MKKIICFILFSLLVVSTYGQAILKHDGKKISLSDKWIDILDDKYQIIYSDGIINVPKLSGVYFNENGLLDVAHFPQIKGDGVIEVDIDNRKFLINGISFTEKGKPGWIWLNSDADIEISNAYNENYLYRASSNFCAYDPFGRGSILFTENGKIDWLLIDKEIDFKYENIPLKISGWILFYENGTPYSIRLSQPKEIQTPVGKYNIGTIGFYDDTVLKYVTIQSEKMTTKYGEISVDQSIDFYNDGKVYVTFITSQIVVNDVEYKNMWIGFDENGDIMGEMELIDDDWVRK